jgi:hypothetical protein
MPQSAAGTQNPTHRSSNTYLFPSVQVDSNRVDGRWTRVARWFAFKPKIQSWVNFGGSCNGRCWYILWTLGPFYVPLLYFMDIWYSSWKFGIFFPFWYFVRRKIWQPCAGRKSIFLLGQNAAEEGGGVLVAFADEP